MQRCLSELEWLHSNNPCDLLANEKEVVLPPANAEKLYGERKLRLFAIACVRRSYMEIDYESFFNPSYQRIIKTAERFADGLATRGELDDTACQLAGERVMDRGILIRHMNEVNALTHINASHAAWIVAKPPHVVQPQHKANIFRDIMPNPFRTLPEIRRSGGSCGGQGLEDLDWEVDWLTLTVRSLAQAAYDDRKGKPTGDGFEVTSGELDNTRLAILADALIDSGCPEMVECLECYEGQVSFSPKGPGAQMLLSKPCELCKGKCVVPNPILEHLRNTDHPHYRGCWALDHILGKE